MKIQIPHISSSIWSPLLNIYVENYLSRMIGKFLVLLQKHIFIEKSNNAAYEY